MFSVNEKREWNKNIGLGLKNKPYANSKGKSFCSAIIVIMPAPVLWIQVRMNPQRSFGSSLPHKSTGSNEKSTKFKTISPTFTM